MPAADGQAFRFQISHAFRLVVLCVLGTAASAALADSSNDVKRYLLDPPREYSTAPLWVWSDLLDEKLIVETLEDLASQNVMQAFVHPRPGLMTPYLSEEWFRLWGVALETAKRLDMNIWIYDENSYPSGFAGGFVPEALPDSRAHSLHFDPVKKIGALPEDALRVFSLKDGAAEDVTKAAKAGELGEGNYLIIRLVPGRSGPWFGDWWYVDLLKPGVTEKFIEITGEAYKKHFGDEFGKRLPGIFTDEPHPEGSYHYNEHVREAFKQKWGYDILDEAASLVRPVGDWKKVRHNWSQTILEQFIEHWSMPWYKWCEDNNLEFTGHYWEHGWPGTSHGPDNMAMYAWHQRPAIDCLFNQYDEGYAAQFGNARAVKELSSAANQLGRRRTLCEAFGAGGWDLRFEDMKRIGEWLMVLGVNTIDEHLTNMSIRGARKRDHPQSFSYHEPWWDSYHVIANRFRRISLALSHGKQINHILVLEPTSTAWMYQSDAKLGQVGNGFQDFVNRLEAVQVEYDLGSEDIMARWGSVDGKTLRVGEASYDTVVLPPITENLNAPVMKLIEEYVKNGGRILCCGDAPAYVDGSASDRGAKAAEAASWKKVDPATLPQSLHDEMTDFAITRAENDPGKLFHQRRMLEDGEILFLVNTSIDHASRGTVESSMGGVEEWNLDTGAVHAVRFEKTDNGVRFDYNLPPCGSRMLFLSKAATTPPELSIPDEEEALTPVGEMTAERIAPNVLTLDFVDVTVGGETKKGIYFYQAGNLIWKKHGFDANPWDMAVQFRDRLITKTFPEDSGFEATYRFTVREKVPSDLCIVIERPDLYTVKCNGTTVTAKEGDWWLDKQFGRIAIARTAKVGENAVTITAKPMTMFHELEPAYVLGDFSLEPAEKGFVIVPPKPLGISKEVKKSHSTDPDGTMWLSGGVEFRPGSVDGDPWVTFDLGKKRDFDAIEVWNYNEVNLTKRGVDEMEVFVSPTGKAGSFKSIGKFRLDQAKSGSVGPTTKPRFPQLLDSAAKGVRFVQFQILSNHNGVRYPTKDSGVDNAFVGLSEVRFLKLRNGKPEPIEGVTVAGCSSELTQGFNRAARYLVDGDVTAQTGWDAQGAPFYAAGVKYAREYDVPGKPNDKSRYFVRLPKWNGSVAKVFVNDQFAGHIAFEPSELDVTDFLKAGKNRIDVVVIGTLRNTLGPHYGNVFGIAGPGHFRHGPATGPPPASEYTTEAYGLFAPFELSSIR